MKINRNHKGKPFCFLMIGLLFARGSVCAVAKDGVVTNEAAYAEQWATRNKRIADFRSEMKTSPDPVALAVEMAKDQDAYCAKAGMDALTERWEDPRTEQTLSALSEKQPRYLRDGLLTLSGEAEKRLQIVQSKKAFRAIVQGSKTQEQETTAILAFLGEHAEYATPVPTGGVYVLRRMLFDELEKSADEKAQLALFRSGQFRKAYAKAHFAALVAFAEALPNAEALANPTVVEALAENGGKEVIPLLEKWLPDAKTRGQKSYIESAIRALREKKE